MTKSEAFLIGAKKVEWRQCYYRMWENENGKLALGRKDAHSACGIGCIRLGGYKGKFSNDCWYEMMTMNDCRKLSLKEIYAWLKRYEKTQELKSSRRQDAKRCSEEST